MASTYINDLRLNEMATGDGSGTWGTTTNTNLELIAEAFSYGTEAITTNADTHTTTIADGASDPGRALYLKYTGTLDSACTITIGPDTVSKVWIIENGTSGSQDIILSQGSGANITIPAGDTKVVYSDGAGAGAAFVDAFASLSVVDLKVQDDLTVTDDASIGGDATITGTLGVTGNITGTLATAAQPNITSVGTLTALTGGTGDLNWDSGTLFVDSSANNVGIGTSSPNYKLAIGGVYQSVNTDLISVTDTATIYRGTPDGTGFEHAKILSGRDATSFTYGSFLSFYTEGKSSGTTDTSTEAMRIDSSGNLLVGKTAVDNTTVGFRFDGSSGFSSFVRDGNAPLLLVRKSDDGDILQFKKDTTTAGSIGSRSSGANLYIALRTETAGDGCGLTGSDSSTGAILPSDGNGATADNHIDLGAPAVRFKDLYLSGGAYLGGTGAANLLDDYEEGDYDVTITCGTSGTVTLNSSFNRAQYTKVGRTVHVSGFLVVSAVSSPLGYFTMNLPFTPANLTERAADSTVTLVIQAIVSANISDFMGTINEDQPFIYVQLGDNNTIQNDSAEQMQVNSYISFSATYAAA
jgi:hypothetical protein